VPSHVVGPVTAHGSCATDLDRSVSVEVASREDDAGRERVRGEPPVVRCWQTLPDEDCVRRGLVEAHAGDRAVGRPGWKLSRLAARPQRLAARGQEGGHVFFQWARGATAQEGLLPKLGAPVPPRLDEALVVLVRDLVAIDEEPVDGDGLAYVDDATRDAHHPR